MSTPILATKLYIPPPRPKSVRRPRLIERLNEGLRQDAGFARKLTLISAPAGYGKTALVSEWVADCERLEPKVRAAWLSLDGGDSDPARFLTYLVAALQTLALRQAEGVAANIGEWALGALQSPQPPPTEAILTALINEIAAIPASFILVLDDYHVIDAPAVDVSTSVDAALAFLLEHLPAQMHLVIATREDPALPLARLRARNQLTELRAADLRFTPAEAAEFLHQVMDLDISAEDIAVLETRTEGWIAGLQLAAISMRGRQDIAGFIRSFTGSHQFVLDYLVEEVLRQQPESVQAFLLRTSILDRMCGPLCDAVLHGDATRQPRPSVSGQATLEYLEHANLFIVPLDNERRWYRYHHLLAGLLRQRLQQSDNVAEYHIRASQWYEDNSLEFEAFHHATAANDVERAERLMEGNGMPLHSRSAVNAILAWLASLPESVLDARPLLRVRSATMALTAGQTIGVEEKLQAAEKALGQAELDPQTGDLIGQIACARATLAVTRYQPEEMAVQARRALEYLLPENRRFRFTANWALSAAYRFQGDRAAARRALTEALSISESSTRMFSRILAVIHLGRLQELDNQFCQAAETYRRVLQMVSEQPQPNASDAHLGLARIYYEWNDLDAAEQYGQQGLLLAGQFDRTLDRSIHCEVFLARLKLARGDVAGAAAMLAEAEQSVLQHNFVQRMTEVAAAQVLVLLRQGDLVAAAHLVQTRDLPISQARVLLAQGDAPAALALLKPLRQQMEAKDWKDERLKVMILQAVALHAHREKDQAVQLLGEALALAEPGGFTRLFVDEGPPMASLLTAASAQGLMPGYVAKLLSAFGAVAQPVSAGPQTSPGKGEGRSPAQPLIEPLSQRELEILRLIAQGLSNREIGARLFLALDTVKGHNRRIFDKLDVQRRTEAIARARELGLL